MNCWLNIGVEGSAMWPTVETTVSFGGHDFLLRPATKETEQSIHINLVRISHIDAHTLINRFLSLLSWCDGQCLRSLDRFSGSAIPISVPKRRLVGGSIAFPFFRDIEQDPKALLALALYREGLSVESVPFEFLSYFKILNIFWKDKYEKTGGISVNPVVEGIRSALPKIQDDQALKRIKKLIAENKDPAKYLYESGRCAIAHAHSDPIVDPDNVFDLHRLSEDMWIIRSIAEHLIEHHLNVRRTIY